MSDEQTTAVVTVDAPSSTDLDVNRLLELAIDKEVSVDAMEKLVTLAERVQDRSAAREFHSAMSQFQEDCPPITKTSKASFTTKSHMKVEYAYASLDHIVATVRPILHRLGMSFRWDSATDGNLLTSTCHLQHENGHTESASFTAPVDGGRNPLASPQQISAISNTYAKRQALVQVLGLSTVDTDTDAAPGAKISDKQLAELEQLGRDAKANMVAYCGFLGVNKLADLPVAHFDFAKRGLEKKKASR